MNTEPQHRSDAGTPRSRQDRDRDIARAAEAALQVTAYLLKNSVKARASDGWVTLTGEVEWDYQRQTAEYAVRLIPGVVGVRDDIKVRPLASIIYNRSEIAAARIRRAREDALRMAGRTGGE